MSVSLAEVETGESLLARGEISAALREFRAALEHYPDDSALLQRLTDTLAAAGLLGEAAELQAERFEQYLRSGRPREACALFNRLNWLQPQPPERWRAYAQALEATGQPTEAERAYRQAAAGFRRDAVGEQEAEAWRAVFRLNPKDYSTCLEIAARAESTGDTQLAGEACGQAAALAHEDVALLARARRLLPDDRGFALRHVRALLGAGNGPDAVAALAALRPEGGWANCTDLELLALHAESLLAGERAEEAAALIEPHLKRADWFERGLRCLHALARIGSLKAAAFAAEIEDKSGLEKRHLQWVRELHLLRAEVSEPAMLDFLADAFNRAGEEPAMLWILHQALDAALSSGDLPRAADLIERILATDPNDPEPAERLREFEGRLPPERWQRLKVAVERSTPARPGPVASPPTPPARRVSRARAPRPAAAAPRRPDHAPASSETLSISQITPVIRALSRETTPRRIFFSAVNHFGRVWHVDRCVAANFQSGQEPVNVVEYCAPGVPSSFAAETTRLLNMVEKQFRPPDAKAVILPRPKEDPATLALLAELGVASLLAQPLNEAGSVIGAVVLQSCLQERAWMDHDLQILEALAEQLVLVLGHARLRSLLQQFTAVDERTGLLKVSSMLEVLVAECARAQQQGSTVAVLCLETIQPARDIAQTPQAQDWMLTVTERMGAYLRPHDVLTRISATQFVLVLPDTIVANCRAVFRKLRAILHDQTWPNGEQLILAAGAAEIAAEFGLQAEDIATDVLDRALRALAAAREQPPGEDPCILAAQPLAAAAAAV